jgi:GTP cyclohydrolase I
MTDRARAKQAIEDFLRAIGRDPSADPELAETGARVTAAFADELCEGYGVDVPALLAAEAMDGNADIVVVRDVAVATTCPHHLMPGTGTASIAYAPRGKLVGIGALAHVVDAFARRLTLQETIGEATVGALANALAPRWAACRLVLAHACMTARGERRHGARVETFAFRGDPSFRAEAMSVLGVGA